MTAAMKYHTPALLNECIEGLKINPDGVYVDATFGGGGHSRAILERLRNGRLIALDRDADAMANLPDDERLVVERGDFKYLQNFTVHNGYRHVDGILADLGVSSHHFDNAGRGFSFQHRDAPLDMRMNANAKLTAMDVVNGYREERLAEIFAQYGELPNARHLARQIAAARLKTAINSSGQLIDAVNRSIPRGTENKFLAKLYQALRIEVNSELECLKSLLMQSIDLLSEGGRLVIIAYHSLEDRLVKNFLKNGMFEGEAEKDIYGNVNVPFRQVNNKVITPSEEEIAANSRARSAKLRIGERISVT
jgi:16S rRNA (cytosine1402-N4)-methyltransferase